MYRLLIWVKVFWDPNTLTHIWTQRYNFSTLEGQRFGSEFNEITYESMRAVTEMLVGGGGSFATGETCFFTPIPSGAVILIHASVFIFPAPTFRIISTLWKPHLWRVYLKSCRTLFKMEFGSYGSCLPWYPGIRSLLPLRTVFYKTQSKDFDD